MSVARVWIGGTRSFNNYALVYWFLKKILPPNAIILSGHAAGPDTIAETYGYLNNHVVEIYEADWERFGKSAGMVRNVEVSKIATHAICFWDGVSSGTKNMIELCQRKKITPMIYDITENDYIKPHPNWVKNVNRDPFDVYIGRGKGSIWGNPFRMDAKHNRQQVIYAFTDYLLKKPKLLSQLESLKDKTLGCFCAPQLCHGDVLRWLIENALPEIKSYLQEISPKNDEGLNPSKNPNKIKDLDASNWPQNGSVDLLVTDSGLTISKGYDRIMYDDREIPYLEINDLAIIKDHIHIPLKEIQSSDEELDDRVVIFYSTNDVTGTKIRYQQVGFDNCVFKAGFWYVQPKFVKLQKNK